MADSFSYTGERVYDDVVEKFGDTRGVQLSNEMILRWINDGQRQIAQQNPFLQKVASAALIAGQTVYPFASHFPADRILEYDGISLYGIPAQVIPFSDYQKKITAMGLAGQKPVEEQVYYAAEYGGAINIWPAPAASQANALTIYYKGLPEDLETLTGLLTVPDRFYNALVQYVLGQAYLLDENFDAASAVLGAASSNLQLEANRENRSPTDFYPAITDVMTGEYDMTEF